MQAKAELASLIVTDFHSAADAARAQEEFNRVVRRHEVPADISTLPLPEGVRAGHGIRIDKLLAKTGLAESVSDAVRKIKAGAVEIDGQRVHGLLLEGAPGELIVQAGKNWRKIVIQS
jgi:tyrosyl-tRNA synthetase